MLVDAPAARARRGGPAGAKPVRNAARFAPTADAQEEPYPGSLHTGAAQECGLPAALVPDNAGVAAGHGTLVGGAARLAVHGERQVFWRQSTHRIGAVSRHGFSDSELCELYRQASFTIYPSLYEGFGFPVLDSLRHGTPVLCSFNSSLAEFAGPGVFYFDAGDPASLDSACRDLLASGLVEVARNDLDHGLSWDRLAHKIVTLCMEQGNQEPAANPDFRRKKA